MKILLLGSEGSIGRKYKQNLDILGYDDIYCYDLILKNNLPESFEGFDLAIIATPTDTHLYYIHICNSRQVPYILCEKPLCKLPTEYQLHPQSLFEELKSQVYVNNAYRFENGIRKLKDNLYKIGRIRYVLMENAYSFQKLHPQYSWGSYDGIIYDDSHIINTSRFLFGEPKNISFKSIEKDAAIFSWTTDQDIKVIHHTNVLNEIYKKRIEVVGHYGNLIYNFGAHYIYFCPADESDRVAIMYNHQSHLLESLKYVIETVEGKSEFKENDIFDAIKDIKIIEGLLA